MPSWTFPWPNVTTNHLYRRTARGGVFLSPKAVAWRDEAVLLVRQSGAPLPEPPWKAMYELVAPDDHRKHDWDNLIKLVQDSIFRELGHDDDGIVEAHIYKRKVGGMNADPCIFVRISKA